MRNLRQNPRVTLAIDDTRGGGDVVIFEGEAELLPQPATEVVPPAYFAKYAAGIEHLGMTQQAMVETYRQAVRVRPSRFLSW